MDSGSSEISGTLEGRLKPERGDVYAAELPLNDGGVARKYVAIVSRTSDADAALSHLREKYGEEVMASG